MIRVKITISEYEEKNGSVRPTGTHLSEMQDIHTAFHYGKVYNLVGVLMRELKRIEDAQS